MYASEQSNELFVCSGCVGKKIDGVGFWVFRAGIVSPVIEFRIQFLHACMVGSSMLPSPVGHFATETRPHFLSSKNLHRMLTPNSLGLRLLLQQMLGYLEQKFSAASLSQTWRTEIVETWMIGVWAKVIVQGILSQVLAR